MRSSSRANRSGTTDADRVAVPPVHVACLLALTFGTGVVDALSWTSLSGVFTANMTGNVLVVGMGAAGAEGADWFPAAFALGWFLLGAALVGRLNLGAERGWSTRTTTVFASVAAVTAVTAAATAVWPPHRFAESGFVVTAVLALAMGAQGAAALHLAVPQLITVAVSSTVVGLGVSLFLGAGAQGTGVLRRALAILLLGLGACAGALLVHVGFAVALLVASLVAASAAVVGHLHPERA